MTILPTERPGELLAGHHFVAHYPPLHSWSIAQRSAVDAALERPFEGRPLGLHVHVPFCRRRCHYCSFRVNARSTPEEMELYLTRLMREFLLYQERPAIRGRRFSTVHIGGGTIAYPSEAQITRLFTGLRAADDWEEVVECTCEVEPGTVSPGKFRLLSDLGVTRLSLSFQTLDDDVLERVGRGLKAADCIDAYEQARAAGFDQINVDLLAGLPGQTDASWNETVERIIALAPECVTVYQLEFTRPATIRAALDAAAGAPLPDWPTKVSWTGAAFERLEAAGYTIASGCTALREPARWRFAHSAGSLWRGGDLLALGQSATGFIDGVNYQNVLTFEGYTRQLAAHRLPIHRAYELTEDEQFRREVILLLKTGSLNTAYFQQKFGRSLAREYARPLGELIQRGYLLPEDDGYRLTREALLIVDWLLPAFYAPEHQPA
jgi:oxygen-independent coproporphyrinogen-3 oxidase